VVSRETDSHGLPAGWNGREAAIPSLRQHLHPANILVSPHQLRQQILALRIQQILPVINPVHDMKTARLGLIEQETGKDGQALEKGDRGRQETAAAFQELQWILWQITW